MGLVLLFLLLVLLAICIGSGIVGWQAARRSPSKMLVIFFAASMLMGSLTLHIQVYRVDSHSDRPLAFLAIVGFAPALGTGLGLVFEFMESRHGWRTWIWLYVAIAVPFLGVGGWPLRLAFLASRPALDRLADRIGRGEPVAFPARAGVFEIVSVRNDPGTGQILLLIEDRASTSQSGFFRKPDFVRPENYALEGTPSRRYRIALRSPWIYKYEDTSLSD